jgi:lambda family phage minor tail protein L
MIDAPDNFIKQLNKETNKPIFLYTVFDYDDASHDLPLAEYDSDVDFDGVTYQTFPIVHDKIGENAQGEIDTISVKVSNVSRLIQNYLETYNWRGKRVMIRLVWADRLAYTDEKMDFFYYIDNYSANQDFAEFTLLPKIDVLTVMLPGRTYSRNYCQWVFKGTECGYPVEGEETSCNKTKQRCQEIGNYLRFGGFPSIPSRQMSIT